MKRHKFIGGWWVSVIVRLSWIIRDIDTLPQWMFPLHTIMVLPCKSCVLIWVIVLSILWYVLHLIIILGSKSQHSNIHDHPIHQNHGEAKVFLHHFQHYLWLFPPCLLLGFHYTWICKTMLSVLLFLTCGIRGFCIASFFTRTPRTFKMDSWGSSTMWVIGV